MGCNFYYAPVEIRKQLPLRFLLLDYAVSFKIRKRRHSLDFVAGAYEMFRFEYSMSKGAVSPSYGANKSKYECPPGALTIQFGKHQKLLTIFFL